MTDVTRIDGCRSCSFEHLHPILELGSLPLANALRTDPSAPEARFPLELVFCERCSLVQITETVRPEVLFEHYLYLSSFSDGMLAHAKAYAEDVRDRLQLDATGLVVEIASNDGYLLQNFVAMGVPVLGIEPAQNIVPAAEARGVRTLNAFFTASLARHLESQGELGSAIIANNVLAHVARLNDFVEGVETLLRPGGSLFLEVPYVRNLIEQRQFDTIYHEHLCYFSLHSVVNLLARHGLHVWDVAAVEVHGGSLRVTAGRPEETGPVSEAVSALMTEEKEAGMLSFDFYRDFGSATRSLLTRIRRELAARREGGQSIAAYGASAKGSTLMNAAGIGPDLLDFIVDRSTVKQGMYAPGNGLPILPPEALLERQPDAVLLLTWNFAEEIIAQQQTYLERGGTFIVPVPDVHTVSAGGAV